MGPKLVLIWYPLVIGRLLVCAVKLGAQGTCLAVESDGREGRVQWDLSHKRMSDFRRNSLTVPADRYVSRERRWRREVSENDCCSNCPEVVGFVWLLAVLIHQDWNSQVCSCRGVFGRRRKAELGVDHFLYTLSVSGPDDNQLVLAPKGIIQSKLVCTSSPWFLVV